jgi:hypothetical protein
MTTSHSTAAAIDTRAETKVIGGIVVSASFVNAYGIPQRIPRRSSSIISTGVGSLLSLLTAFMGVP